MHPLKDANRAILRAIERPPDTGLEPRLDRLAAYLWRLAESEELAPDAGRLCRLSRKLTELQHRASEPRTPPLREARELVREYAAQIEPSH